MARVYTAAQPTKQVVPLFRVKELEGTYQHVVTKKAGPNKPLEKHTEERPNGYLVEFPLKGHSVHIRTYAELEALGFTATTVPLVSADEKDDSDHAEGFVPNVISKAKG